VTSIQTKVFIRSFIIVSYEPVKPHAQNFFESAATVSTKACKANFAFSRASLLLLKNRQERSAQVLPTEDFKGIM